MKKIKKKNGVSQQHYEADKDLVAKSGATFCVKVIMDSFSGKCAQVLDVMEFN